MKKIIKWIKYLSWRIDWEAVLWVIIIVFLVILTIACITFGLAPGNEDFDVAQWVANPANPGSPLH